MPKKVDPNCCLCGLPYERIGNNPAPLAQKGRCCDACDEVVIEARMSPAQLLAEQDRVMESLLRMRNGKEDQRALAAICASRGPVLLAEKQRQFAKLHGLVEGVRADLKADYERRYPEVAAQLKKSEPLIPHNFRAGFSPPKALISLGSISAADLNVKA